MSVAKGANNDAIPALLDNTLKFVSVASHGMKRACDEIKVHRSMQKKAADLIPATVEALVKTGSIRPDQVDAAKAILGSHAETLQMLKRANDQIARLKSGEKRAGDRLGSGVADSGQPEGYDSLQDPRVGLKTSEKKASDLAILRVLESPR